EVGEHRRAHLGVIRPHPPTRPLARAPRRPGTKTEAQAVETTAIARASSPHGRGRRVEDLAALVERASGTRVSSIVERLALTHSFDRWNAVERAALSQWESPL